MSCGQPAFISDYRSNRFRWFLVSFLVLLFTQPAALLPEAKNPDFRTRPSNILKAGIGTLDPAAQKKFQQAYGKIPMSFERNEGQTDPQVRFLSRGNGYSLFLTPAEAVLTLRRPFSEKTGTSKLGAEKSKP